MSAELLVTGGGGLLGSALKQLRPDARFVTRCDYDLTDITQVIRLFAEARPKRVLHLAARVGGVKTNAAQNADLFSQNVQINTNVLAVAQRFEVSRLVSVLCSCAFAIRPDRPSKEADLHAGMPYEGNLGYGCSKRMLDVHTKLLHEQYGCRFSTIAPATIYGPHDNFDLEDGHVVAALIHRCSLAIARQRPLEVWGTGSAVRQFVFALDIARLALWELDRYDGPETMIVAPDHGVTIRHLVELIARVMNHDGPIVFDHSKPEGQLIKVLESTTFAGRYPRFCFTPLEEGLDTTAAWFLEQHPDLATRNPRRP